MSITKSVIFVLVTHFFTFSALADTNSSKTPTNNSVEPLATYQEALSYLLGRNGKTKSAEKAAVLFKSLAEQNWSSAQHMLGNLYFKGKGVEKNDLLAYKWLSIASRDNMQLASAISDKRKSLQNKLSDTHLQQVEAWISDWRPSN
jgi:TPR repeat protein